MEVTNLLERKAFELTDEENVRVIKIWLGQEGLHLIKYSQMKRKKNKKNSKMTLQYCHKLKLCHNRIRLLLQYLKLKRKGHELAEEWVGRLQTKAGECDLRNLTEN